MRSLRPQQVRHFCEGVDNVASLHHNCFACGSNGNGLGLTFDQDEAGNVLTEWFCEEKYQSYPGIVHGGVVATLLDCAMTNCLLMRGIPAVTANMCVEYQEPVRVGNMVKVRARLLRSRSPLFVLEAEVIQNGRVSARASAKFMCTDVWSEMSSI
ncbi:MAG: PaaI family thioesterase [Armatimonadota bacterium]|nr:PaaI family thioesterase [Armatimonadota bacterium]